MSNISITYANTILDTMLSGVYLALYTSNPTDSGAGTEVSGGGYTRQSITFSAASNRSASSSNNITFTSTADWGTITGYGILSASTGGVLRTYGLIDLTPDNVVTGGNNVIIQAGQIVVKLM